jgi:hypothetical protein
VSSPLSTAPPVSLAPESFPDPLEPASLPDPPASLAPESFSDPLEPASLLDPLLAAPLPDAVPALPSPPLDVGPLAAPPLDPEPDPEASPVSVPGQPALSHGSGAADSQPATAITAPIAASLRATRPMPLLPATSL